MMQPAEVNFDPDALPDGATTTTGLLVQEVFQTSPEPPKSFEVLMKIITNIMANPGEPKFREVKKANNIIRASIVSVPPCATLLRRCGFVDQGAHFALQKSGLRQGELSRLRVALAFIEATRGLSESLNGAMVKHFGRGVWVNLGPAQDAGGTAFANPGAGRPKVVLASAQEVASAGLKLGRSGWTLFQNYDADAYEDAHVMSAHSLEDCMRVAEENGFGGISVWEGQAYFRESTGPELKQRLQRSPGAVFYTYVPPYLESSAGVGAPVMPPAAPPVADEDDEDLQAALRLSMMTS